MGLREVSENPAVYIVSDAESSDQSELGFLGLCCFCVWLLHYSVDGWLITVSQPVPLIEGLVIVCNGLAAWDVGLTGC